MIFPSSTRNVVSFSLGFQPVRSLPLKRGMKPSSFLSSWTDATSRTAASRVFTSASPLVQFHQPDVPVRDGIAVVLEVQWPRGVVGPVVRRRRRVLAELDLVLHLDPVVQHRHR